VNKARNPYSGLGDAHFWRRAISRVERHLVDPVVSTGFRIGREDRVATAGSCFAQHIARRLGDAGFNYQVVEAGEGLSEQERKARNYRVFSARYGNIYNTRQLLQLFRRAHGEFVPIDDHWLRPDGRYADPFRPNIEPEGFASVEELRADRDRHLDAVRELFATTDVFVFTLGLTEGWRSRRDGAAYPLAPGVVAGEYSEAKHEFVNAGAAETAQDLKDFLAALRAVNPDVRVLLTVSPVPLVATHENRHVLVSTTYSKSVLRVAAEETVRTHESVDYFPSYEIITGSFNFGTYYEADAREVTEPGVAHAMRCFMANYLEPAANGRDGSAAPASLRPDGPSDPKIPGDVVCDEEAIGQIDI
jgi:hypothetical protein